MFTLEEALSEIRALRQHKRILLEQVRWVAGHIGGPVGEGSARALRRIEEANDA